MTGKYKIQLSIKAKIDLKNITSYIKNNLQEPNTAKKYAKLIKGEIKTLEYNPQKFSIIDIKIKNNFSIRKLVIKSYIAFYIINEKDKIVSIDRILYGASNWQNKI